MTNFSAQISVVWEFGQNETVRSKLERVKAVNMYNFFKYDFPFFFGILVGWMYGCDSDSDVRNPFLN